MTSEKWAQKFHTDSLRSRCQLLMTYPDLGSASNWLKQISHASQPVRGTTQIWEASCISMEFLHMVASQNVGCFQWRIQERGPPPSVIFRPNWGPKGRNIFCFSGPPPPPPIPGSGWPGPPLSEGQDLPLVSLVKPRPPMELNLWLSLSAKHCWNPCFGLLPVYQDLSMCHDWPV